MEPSFVPSRIDAAPEGPWPGFTWRTVFRITAAFWLYVTIANLVTVSLLMGAAELPSLAARLLQHAVMLPLLVLCYHTALRIGWPASRRARVVLLQFLLGIGFAATARFVLWATYATVMADPAWMTPATMELVPELRAIGVTFLNFFLPYWAGLALLVGVLSFRRLRDVTLRAAHIEGEYVKARLQALRGQLNPHFLFNTLHSVWGLIDERPATARTMLVRLSDLLRRSLRDGEDGQIPLADELALARSYLEIQQLRFSDRLTFGIEHEVGLDDALVPGFLIQPLAENAIKHGMADEADAVDVRIRARRDGELLEVEVANSASRPAGGVQEFGVGLRNTSERLATLYGDVAQLAFERPAGHGFVVRVRLPLRHSPARAAA